MNTTTLHNAIAGLADLDRNGLLSELRMAFTQRCRKAGGLPPAEWRERLAKSDIDVNTEAIAQAASHLFGGEISDWRHIAEQELQQDQFTDIALQLIAEMRAGIAPTPADIQPIADEDAENKPPQPLRRMW